MLVRRRKPYQEIAELLRALLENHRTDTIYFAWNNVDTHEKADVEALLRRAAGSP